MKKYIISLDQGTSGTTAAILSFPRGHILAQVTQPVSCSYPKPGWVEQDPEEIWSSCKKALLAVIKKAKIDPCFIQVMGITNQRETIVCWDAETEKTLGPAIVWQCGRTTEFCKKLSKNKKLAHEIHEKTGLIVDPYFSASKIRWLLENKFRKQGANIKNLRFGTVDSFLIYRLTRQHKTDVSNASRTQLMNLKTLDWDRSLLKFFKIPLYCLPEICDSNDDFGVIDAIDPLRGVHITGVLGDQQAALLGQGCVKEGQMKCTYGTGSFSLLNTGEHIVRSQEGLLSTLAWKLKYQPCCYALEGSSFICGSAITWLKDQLGIIAKAQDVEKLAKSVKDTGGVGFIPSFVGLGSPHWQPQARGMLYGLNPNSGPAHIARGVLESLALQNVDIMEAMAKNLKGKIQKIRVDGGASQNNLLMQMQSDFSGVSVERPKCIESTVLGAAFMAGLGMESLKGRGKDDWTLEQIETKNKVQKSFSPKLPPKARKAKKALWNKAVQSLIHLSS